MRIALGLEYDGAAFCGWQTQPSACGVQDELQQGLARFVGSPVEVPAAGRTDAGVHALAQVVHFDSPVEREPIAWIRGTNTMVKPDLRVQWAAKVPDDFHARYSARSRTYRYLLRTASVAPAVLRGRVGWYHKDLDLDAVERALVHLRGEHDFSVFRDAECQAKSPIRNLMEASVERAGSLVVFTFRANAFLHHMVRNVVGCLVYVGAGKHPPGWIAELIEARDRRLAAPTFMADGLYLAGVEYDPALGLPKFAAHPLLELTSP